MANSDSTKHNSIQIASQAQVTNRIQDRRDLDELVGAFILLTQILFLSKSRVFSRSDLWLHIVVQYYPIVRIRRLKASILHTLGPL